MGSIYLVEGTQVRYEFRFILIEEISKLNLLMRFRASGNYCVFLGGERDSCTCIKCWCASYLRRGSDGSVAQGTETIRFLGIHLPFCCVSSMWYLYA
jgi:hypothetical protein